MAERTTNIGATRRETASLLVHALVTRLAVTPRVVPPPMQPTIFLPLRRGEDPSWEDVVARNV